MGRPEPMETAGTRAEHHAGAPMDPVQARNLNADALAYMGDAVYEKMIRERLLRQGVSRVDRLHHKATGYVSAAAQARIIRTVFAELTEQEQDMVKRWRNHKYHSKAKNADPMTYKWATAFEALTGFLYLTGDMQRLDWLFTRAVNVIDSSAGDGSREDGMRQDGSGKMNPEE